MPDHRPFEYSEITPLIFVGTNACCRDHFNEMLLARGIRADISLEDDKIDAPFGADFYVWLPTPDHAAPAAEELEFGVAALQRLEKMGVACYVHCRNGHGRASTLVASFLAAKEGWTAEQAIIFVKERRPRVHFEKVQTAAIGEFAKRQHA